LTDLFGTLKRRPSLVRQSTPSFYVTLRPSLSVAATVFYGILVRLRLLVSCLVLDIEIGCLYLDKRHRLIQFEELFRGTIDGASVHPREIVKLALQRNSAAVIVAHNHPSGIAEPSQADELITQRVKEALALVDIRLLDHIIVGDGASVSLAERGLL
jgi:hypothetical protein